MAEEHDAGATYDGKEIPQKTGDDKFRYKAAAFLTGVAGASMLGGFGMTLGMAKKKDPHMFNKGMIGARDLHEAGGALAMRALGWGTFYAVTGFSLVCFCVWKLTGSRDLQEFRMKAGSILPKIPKNNPPQSRTEFEGLTDLLQYLINEDERKKQEQIRTKMAGPD
ncbi:transmembrane protein 242-like [Penaeus japonicus]|uniref:transmembrane protein 242-like n=1 Tax=Penaeus japonicus TaxID=27405 RepID=UPI001C711F82|nr:transmembrane protein 242-like [Penaeus japonicus]